MSLQTKVDFEAVIKQLALAERKTHPNRQLPTTTEDRMVDWSIFREKVRELAEVVEAEYQEARASYRRCLQDQVAWLEKRLATLQPLPTPEEIREKLGAAAGTISSEEREAEEAVGPAAPRLEEVEPEAKEGVVWSFRYPASEKKSLAEQVARPGFKALILPLGHGAQVSVGVKKEEGVAFLCASVNGAGTTLQLTTLQIRELREMLQAVDTLLTYPPIPPTQDPAPMHPMEFE